MDKKSTRAIRISLWNLQLLWIVAGACCGQAMEGTPIAESKTDPKATELQAVALRERAQKSFQPIRASTIPSGEPAATRFQLGRQLFFEKGLSADGQVSCATCHMAEHGGGDGLAKSVGVMGRENPRNAPSVFNAVLQSSQHWRGDRASLADQAARSPLGMASFGNKDEAQAMERLRKAGQTYQAEFERAFPDDDNPMTLASFGEAVASFERTLLTPARFDAFLMGDNAALSARELAGLQLFLDTGCAGCHAGQGVGGSQLAKFGVVEPYAELTGSDKPDQGRFDVTQVEADRFVFKVPVLRNVTETAPYFHDGSVLGLEQAVRVMARVQLGADLKDHEVSDIVAFLGALSGTAPQWFSAP